MNNPSQNGSFLSLYLQKHSGNAINAGAVAFYASLDQVSTVSPVVAQGILNELRDQRHNL
jgi:glycine hydroxymethyltransferase